jgi:hypothetical protein
VPADKQLYAEVAKCFADFTFPKNTPLHMLALLYAGEVATCTIRSHVKSHTGQAQGALEHGGRSLVSQGFGFNPRAHASLSSEGSLLDTWRQTLAAILANKTMEWDMCVNTLGARLEMEVSFRAHRDVASSLHAMLGK